MIYCDFERQQNSVQVLLLLTSLTIGLAACSAFEPAENSRVYWQSTTVPLVKNGRTSEKERSAACHYSSPPVSLGRLPAVLDEASGMDSHSVLQGVYWLHNDSGGAPAVYAVDTRENGGVYKFMLEGADNRDWEDLGIGACSPETEDSCIYLADIGDNWEGRDSITIYRVREPLSLEQETTSLPAEAMQVTYPDSPHNAEAMAVDGVQLFLFSKSSGATSVYTHKFIPGGSVILEHRRDVDLRKIMDSKRYQNQLITAADWDQDSGELVLRTYRDIYIWKDLEGGVHSILHALQSPQYVLVPGAEFQGESIAWDDRAIIHVSEGHRPPVWKLECR